MDVEVLETAPIVFMTPHKKKTFKVREKLGNSFLRRSKGFPKSLMASRMKKVLRRLSQLKRKMSVDIP